MLGDVFSKLEASGVRAASTIVLLENPELSRTVVLNETVCSEIRWRNSVGPRVLDKSQM